MIEQTPFNPEEPLVSFEDVKRLYLSTWKKLVKWAFLGAAAGFLAAGNRNIKYKAEASFREEVEQRTSENVIRDLIGGSSSHHPQAASFMKSYEVLRPLVAKMGLQVAPVRSEWKVKKWLSRYLEAFKAEKKIPLPDPDPFVFENVLYDQESTALFSLVFSENGHFAVYDGGKKKEMGRGVLGTPLELESPPLQFTLKKTPSKIKPKTHYLFSVSHWVGPAGALKGEVKIKNDKENRSLIQISWSHRDRHLAARIVNELMLQYQSYLKREYDLAAKDQLSYLEGKQKQLIGQMEEIFQEHASYLSRSVAEKGFAGLEQETQSLLAPHEQMRSKVLAIEIELGRLTQIEKEGKGIGIGENSLFSQSLNEIMKKVHDCQEQKDLIELSFCQTSLPADRFPRDELKEVRSRRFSLEKMIGELERGDAVTVSDLGEGLFLWAQKAADSEEKEDLSEYLENYSRLLSMKEKMLQEQFFSTASAPEEFEGIDLASSKELFLKYTDRLDEAQGAILHYQQFKNQIANPHFDLASLGSILKEPFCQKIIEDASDLELKLKDEKHRSAKEEERWKEEISLSRKVLSEHLDQLCQAEEINIDLCRRKINGLQKASLDCLRREISVLHGQIGDGLKEWRQALLQEKELLEKKMEDLRTSLSSILPEKWRFEKWLGIKTLMVSKIMETITEVVESKTMAAHLHHVQSKPLDRAVIPIHPDSLYLWASACLGAFFLPASVFSFSFFRQLLKGFPATGRKLRAMGFSVLGEISFFCDGPSLETPSGADLDLLRKISLFAEGGKIIGLIGGKGPDYSYALGENLGRRKLKTVFVRADFSSPFKENETPGILQFWKGEIKEVPIRKGNGFDYIAPGGYTPFGTEILQSFQFQTMIDFLKKEYESVFIWVRAPLSSPDCLAALKISDQGVVTLSGESTQELTPFIHWGYDEGDCRITFVASG